MRLFLLGVFQCGSYLVATINIRAATRGLILPTVITDIFLCFISFNIIRLVGEAQSQYEVLPYAAGGALGSAIAILLTRKWDADTNCNRTGNSEGGDGLRDRVPSDVSGPSLPSGK